MGFLGSLLPGLRELRAPLASGYLWLLCVVLWMHEWIVIRSADTPLISDAQRLSGWLGRPALLGAAAFAAYLIGILSVAATDTLIQRLARYHPRSAKESVVANAPLSARGVGALHELLLDKAAASLRPEHGGQTFSQGGSQLLSKDPDAEALLLALNSSLAVVERRAWLSRHINLEDELHGILVDLELVPSRLLTVQPEVYSRFDRQVAEGEFRAAVAVPLAALFITVGLHFAAAVSIVALVAALVLAAMLTWQGRARIVTAYDDLAETLRASGGKGSEALTGFSANSLRIKDPGLDAAEIKTLDRYARAAITSERPAVAVDWLAILAKTGNRAYNELLCDLVRGTRRYADDPRLLTYLGDGSLHSGRLALEFAVALAEAPLGPEADAPRERGWAFGQALLNAVRDERTREVARSVALEAHAHLPAAEQEMFKADLSAVMAGDLVPSFIYRRYEPPPTDSLTHLAQRLQRAVSRLQVDAREPGDLLSRFPVDQVSDEASAAT
ncbi:hypothetical protein [Angustibacter peucedani]